MPILMRDYFVMTSHFSNSIEKELIIMIPISEKEENSLDNGNLVCNRGGFKYYIDSSQVICYGEIDFSDNSDDFKVISAMNWLDHLTQQGIRVPSDYNYKEHCCYSPIKFCRYYDTTNPAIVSQYAHACLGKPQRVCIFREKRKK